MQKKEIIIGCQKVNYTLKKYRRQKRVNLIFHQDGSLVVTTPFLVTQKMVEEILQKNSQWIEDKLKQENNFPVLQDLKQIRKAKNFAKLIIENKLKFFNEHYQLSYKKITIRDQRTRWGSCSSLGSLNFNYKIIYLSEELREYIVVHELCHLQEMNHSSNFWNLVAQKIPNYRELRRELKKIKVV